jgi:rfaE bifunctional protein kinase chain/domain
LALEEAAVKSVGGQLVFTDDDLAFSASKLVSRYLPVFPEEVSDYLISFSARYRPSDLRRYFEQVQALKVLVIGEAIIDEYQYCETIGKSGKEHILVAKYKRSEKFAGGVLAVANHVAAFCDQVSVLTFLGKRDSQEEFIRQKLGAKIEKIFLYMDNAPTIVKRRFIESYPFQKLFELYVMGDSDEENGTVLSQMLCAKLREALPEYDVVIVTDYGHGMFSPEAIEVLCHQARFLAVNTQVNAGNYGFNTVSKYPRANYVSVSEKEIRLDARSQQRDLRDIVLEVANKLLCERMMITRGQRGSLCYSQAEGFVETPALSLRVVDRVGAGDAVFSVTSLCAALQVPAEALGFIGNVVGAQAVAMVGNESSIEREALLQHIESLLK